MLDPLCKRYVLHIGIVVQKLLNLIYVICKIIETYIDKYYDFLKDYVLHIGIMMQKLLLYICDV